MESMALNALFCVLGNHIVLRLILQSVRVSKSTVLEASRGTSGRQKDGSLKFCARARHSVSELQSHNLSRNSSSQRIHNS